MDEVKMLHPKGELTEVDLKRDLARHTAPPVEHKVLVDMPIMLGSLKN
jgi:hypothetical protein